MQTETAEDLGVVLAQLRRSAAEPSGCLRQARKDVVVGQRAQIVVGEFHHDFAFVEVPIAEFVDPSNETVRLRGGTEELDWSGFISRFSLNYYFNVPSPF